MQATELRLGNKVMWDGNPGVITSIEEKTVGVMLDNGYSVWPYIGSVKGIVLTAELLEKCGFKKDGFGLGISLATKVFNCCKYSQLHFSGDYLYLRQGANENRADDDICTIWNKDLMKTFHLHQLQNLFYSLTGAELKIEL